MSRTKIAAGLVAGLAGLALASVLLIEDEAPQVAPTNFAQVAEQAPDRAPASEPEPRLDPTLAMRMPTAIGLEHDEQAAFRFELESVASLMEGEATRPLFGVAGAGTLTVTRCASESELALLFAFRPERIDLTGIDPAHAPAIQEALQGEHHLLVEGTAQGQIERLAVVGCEHPKARAILETWLTRVHLVLPSSVTETWTAAAWDSSGEAEDVHTLDLAGADLRVERRRSYAESGGAKRASTGSILFDLDDRGLVSGALGREQHAVMQGEAGALTWSDRTRLERTKLIQDSGAAERWASLASTASFKVEPTQSQGETRSKTRSAPELLAKLHETDGLAALALNLGQPGVLAATLELARTSTDLETRRRAIDAIALGNGPAAQRALLQLAQDPNTPQELLQNVFLGFGDAGVIIPEALTFLGETLRDPSTQRQGRAELAAQALGYLASQGTPEVAEGVAAELAARLESQAPEGLEGKLVEALGNSKSPLALGPIGERVASESPELRARAVVALRSFESEEAQSLIVEAAQDSDADVRLAATLTLGSRDPSVASEAVLTLLRDDDPQVRGQATSVAGAWLQADNIEWSEGARESLVEALNKVASEDSARAVRARAESALSAS
jgi:HEAT repeat protein